MLSVESLSKAFEESTGDHVAIEKLSILWPSEWREGFRRYFFKGVAPRLAEENPHYFEMIGVGAKAVGRLPKRSDAALALLIGTVVYRAMEIELEKAGEEKADSY